MTAVDFPNPLVAFENNWLQLWKIKHGIKIFNIFTPYPIASASVVNNEMHSFENHQIIFLLPIKKTYQNNTLIKTSLAYPSFNDWKTFPFQT